MNLSELGDVVAQLELEDDDVSELHHRIGELGIELTDDCGRNAVEATRVTNHAFASQTTDALQLFLNELGRYALLTAAEEIELS